MTAKLDFYHNPQSRSSTVRWMLEEVGADYQMHPISFEAGDNRKPEFLAINPMGKIPTLVADGTVITETPAIVAWLADAYPAAGLAPAIGSPERGTWYRWLFFGGSCFEPALLDQMLQRPQPERKGMLGWGSYDDVIDTLEKALTPGPWLLGETFSAADVYIGASLAWAGMFGAPRVKESGPIAAYVRRVTERPAYKKANQA